MSSVGRQGDVLRVLGRYEGELGDRLAIAVLLRSPPSESWELGRPPADVDPDGTWRAEIEAEDVSSGAEVSAVVVDSQIFLGSPPGGPALAPHPLWAELERRGPAATGVEAAAEPIRLED
jgi:hypothetical protein